MTDKEILEQAIQKAIDGGWKAPSLLLALYHSVYDQEIKGQHIEMIRGMITSHNFAKSLWGDTTDYTVVNMPYPDTPPRAYLYQNGYKYHLQQMVLAEDPIKYLGENI